MKRIAVYYRVSTDKQDLSSQAIAFEEWLSGLPEDKKPKEIKVFKDEAKSGKETKNRPSYLAMMKLIEAQKVDGLVVYKLDRLTRDASTAIRTILNIDDLGLGFISLTQPVLSFTQDPNDKNRPFRRTMLAAFAELAQMEREAIVERVKAGLRAARKRGTKLGNRKVMSEEVKNRIVELLKSGLSAKAVAEQVGLSLTTVYDVNRKAS